MTGLEYEHLVARYLTNRGYHGIKVTKGSSDYGVDIIAHKHGKKYAVQCKLYSGSVGLSAVQEAVAGKAVYGCNGAMVVTNSTFTKAAYELADANDVILIEGVTAGGKHTAAKGLLIFMALIYLLVAAAIICATIETVKDQPILMATYNVISISVIVTLPFWIAPTIKGVWNMIKNLILKRKRKSTEVIADPPKVEPLMSVDNSAPAHEYPDGFKQYLNRRSTQSRPPLMTCDSDYNKERAFEELKRIKVEQEDVYNDLYEVFKLGANQGFLSTSIVQRQMKWGYARAVRMLDAMEALCFITPIQCNAQRHLLVSEQDVIDLIAKVECET